MQSGWQAQRKTASTWAAFVHATLYSLPFLLLLSGPLRRRLRALLFIWATHLLIDRFRLARYLVFAKEFFAPRAWWPRWEDCRKTGYSSATPDYLATWLMIIADNATHLALNTFALEKL